MKRLDNSYHDDKLNIFIRDTKKDCGFDDGTLLADMDAAEQAWKQEQLEHPEEAARIMQESDAKFEELMRRIEVEGIQPASTGHEAWEDAELESDVEWDAFDEDEFDGAEDDDEEEDVRLVPNIPTVSEKTAVVKPDESVNEEVPGEAAMAESTVAEEQADKKRVLFKKKKKVLLLVAAVAVLGAGTTLVAQGKREYKLRQYPVEAEKNIIINHNSVYKEAQVGKLKDVYEKIEKQLGLDALILNYIPTDMEYERLLIEDNRAIISFNYDGKNVFFKEIASPTSKELSEIIASDRMVIENVQNFWLDKEIQVEENILDNGYVEYSAGIGLGDSYYYLSGIMDKEEFVNIVKNISK